MSRRVYGSDRMQRLVIRVAHDRGPQNRSFTRSCNAPTVARRRSTSWLQITAPPYDIPPDSRCGWTIPLATESVIVARSCCRLKRGTPARAEIRECTYDALDGGETVRIPLARFVRNYAPGNLPEP